MKSYEFSLLLTAAELIDQDCSTLFESGCDDGTVVTRNGVTYIAFDRRSDSLEEAIRSAIADVRAAGFDVARVVLVPAPASAERRPGTAVGKLTIVEEDDAHLGDFRQYMPPNG